MVIGRVEIDDRALAAYCGEKLVHSITIGGFARAWRPND